MDGYLRAAIYRLRCVCLATGDRHGLSVWAGRGMMPPERRGG